MPRKRPNPLAPPVGDTSDTTVPSSKKPREFKARMYRERLKPNNSRWTAKGYKKGTQKGKKKPGAVVLGQAKGMYRKTDTGYKKRRFTFKQRQTFRAKKGPVFGGPDSGRPKP